jgi:hypothetical protein
MFNVFNAREIDIWNDMSDGMAKREKKQCKVKPEKSRTLLVAPTTTNLLGKALVL